MRIEGMVELAEWMEIFRAGCLLKPLLVDTVVFVDVGLSSGVPLWNSHSLGVPASLVNLRARQ